MTHVLKVANNQPRPIENITDEKTICGIRYVKVGWKNAPYYASSWEPLEILREEVSYQSILRSKGLLYDEHISKSSSKHSCSILTSKKRNTKATTKRSTKFNGPSKESLERSTSPTENHMDEDSTSINDVRGLSEVGREGTSSPFSKNLQIKFMPYITPKTRLTTNFYRDLVQYYRLCHKDQTPLPLPERKEDKKLQPHKSVEREQKEAGTLEVTEENSGGVQVNSNNTDFGKCLDEVGKRKETADTIDPATNDGLPKDAVSSNSKGDLVKLEGESSNTATRMKRPIESGHTISPMSKQALMFGELLSLAKKKLLVKKGWIDTDVPNIFCKFEDREGIANLNEEEYKNSLQEQAPKKAPLDREVTLMVQKPQSVSIQKPVILPTSEPKDSKMPYIPNQPTITLSVAMKQNFVK